MNNRVETAEYASMLPIWKIKRCVLSNPSAPKLYKITFFKMLIGVTACNIVGTLYW